MAKYKIAPFFKKDYPVTQYYGENLAYYKKISNGSLKNGHEGTDFGTPNGTPILAPFNGIILRDVFNDKDYGVFTVVWDPLQHCAVWFCHLQDIAYRTGDKVLKGAVLGHTNNTGNSTGPHCHVNFVETDAFGNRLNTNNGSLGFLNILDTALVEFTKNDIIVDDMPPYLKEFFKINGLDVNNEGQMREFLENGKNYPSLKKDKENADREIKDLRDINSVQAIQLKDKDDSIGRLEKDLLLCRSNTVEIPRGTLRRLWDYLWG